MMQNLLLILTRITHRQHFPHMTIRFIPVNDAAAMLRINPEIDRSMHVTAIRNTRRFDAMKNGVEIVLAHAKTKMNRWNRISSLIEVERQSIIHKRRREWAHASL
jgi:hypothetical protein